MEIRPYSIEDAEACSLVFKSNMPTCFSPGQRAEFEQFLRRPECSYFVMEHEDSVVGCGGYFTEAQSARLVWGIIRRDVQKMGLGRFLLLYRLREIGKAGTVSLAQAETTQLAAAFFERQGFRVTHIEPDGLGPGFDRISVVKRLTVCS